MSFCAVQHLFIIVTEFMSSHHRHYRRKEHVTLKVEGILETGCSDTPTRTISTQEKTLQAKRACYSQGGRIIGNWMQWYAHWHNIDSREDIRHELQVSRLLLEKFDVNLLYGGFGIDHVERGIEPIFARARSVRDYLPACQLQPVNSVICVNDERLTLTIEGSSPSDS